MDMMQLPAANQDSNQALSLETYRKWIDQIENQPAWRYKSDREMDYVDGNQLDSEILALMKANGIPPAIESIIGPAIKAVLGFEAKTRTDWRVTADGVDDESKDVAEALNYKLNQAERASGADRACSEAFKPQLCVGVGWVEVSKNSNPFEYPYRCTAIHRNEIFWDMLAKKDDLSDARYLIRKQWVDVSVAKEWFPGQEDLINVAMGRTTELDILADGGAMTSLMQSIDDQRGWSVEEQQWRDAERDRVCLHEVWYRRWVRATVLRSPDGRVVELDRNNPAHGVLMAAGMVRAESALIPKVRVSFWMGPHKLHDGPTPYRHYHFPYVPFWGEREDRTGVPYGVVRGMMYQQDNVNSTISKIRWGLAATRTIRTEGALAYDDDIYRRQASRIDADIVLDAEHMAKPGATFKVERDFQLNEQQYKMLQDSRMAIERSSGISASFQGQRGNATSGLQESTQIEQSTQSLADLMDNFRAARTQVGELLLAMIIDDLGGRQNETVTIEGNVLKPDRTVVLNTPTTDPLTRMTVMTNDVQRTRLKVALSDVPSTPSFRSQQLSAMSEAFKSMPQQHQVVALPHLLSLMDIPNKDEIIEAIRKASEQQTPEQIQEAMDGAVQDALRASDREIRLKELELKYNPDKIQAEISKIVSETVKNGVQSAFAAMQAGGVIAQNPTISPVADVVMQQAGWRPPSPAGQDPNYPQPAGVMPIPALDVRENTSPQLPPVPQQADSGAMRGIEGGMP